MNLSEYMVLNLVIVFFPLALSFDRKVAFFRKWKLVFPVIMLTALPFILWDALVTGRHWYFNESYTLPFRPLGIPLEEILFFITVPYAVLFIWEVLTSYRLGSLRSLGGLYIPIQLLLTVSGIFSIMKGWEYPLIVILFLIAMIEFQHRLVDSIFFTGRFMVFLLILSVLILIFNGFLTCRPVVLYNEAFKTGVKIFTIPVEDFFYGISLAGWNIALFEFFKKRGAQ
ncbi:MAG: hypothetical protein Kow00108_21770 [Calditrichia bacterium]